MSQNVPSEGSELEPGLLSLSLESKSLLFFPVFVSPKLGAPGSPGMGFLILIFFSVF